MTALWTSDAAAAATGGQNSAPWTATGVSIDTRTLRPGDLFVALKDTRDGHDYVADAFARGAAAALVSTRPEGVAPTAPCLLIDDVLGALCALGRAARARTAARVFAVTGSVGKTGAKEMLRTCLSAEGPTHAAEKSYNNHWGVPLTLARMPAASTAAVIEIGMNAPGEIAPLARLARPDVALITTVAPVHLAAFADVAGIAREKASIVEGLAPGGLAVLPTDIDTAPILADAARARAATRIGFGTDPTAEMRLLTAEVHGTATADSATWRGAPFLFRIGAPGVHLAHNALGVLAALAGQGGDLARAALALGAWVPPEGRGARTRLALGPGGLDGHILLIDESYNANPAALGAALEVFATVTPEPPRGRRIALLGDMLELGPEAAALHAAMAKHPAMAAVGRVHTAGPLMRALHDALPAAQQGTWFPDTAAMARAVPRLLGPGDAAMIKGSLGSRLSVVVDAVRELGQGAPPAGEEDEV